MFAAGKTAAVSGETPDAQFNYVTMLLHGDGTNGAQNNTFLDSSTNNFTITRNGNTTQGSFSPYGSNWSNYFDGSTDWFSVADNSALDFDAGDLTAEAWIYLSDATVVNTVVAKGFASAGGWMLWVQSTLRFRMYDASGSSITAISSASLTSNSWNHVAATRSGNTLTVYINGVSSGTATFSGTSTNSAALEIGAYNSGNGNLAGYISNLRLVKGTAVYTGNFTPSTTPLTAVSGTSLLTCQSNRFIDNSANNFTLTKTGDISVQRFNPFGASTAYSTSVIGGSGYFDGSGDTLTTSTSQIIPTGSFTVECWAYVTGSGSNQKFVAQGSSGAAGRFSIGIEGNNWWVQLGSDAIQTGTPVRNQWNYVAVTYNGSTITLYVNGTSIGTVSSTANAQNTTLTIGQDWNSYIVTGYVADVRISNTVRTITTPTAPYSSDGSTRLLLSMTNGAIFDNAMMNDLETVGNAQISTSVVKYGTGSLKFDGTGDYLKGAFNPWLALGTGDYTIELWINFSSVSTSVFFGDIDSSGAGNWAFFYNSSVGVLRLLMNNGSVTLSSSSWTPSTSTWYHIAICRASGTYRFFVNGTVTGSGSDSTNITWGTNNYYVGSASDGGLQLNGYIDDLRITKGFARYTGNFTAPTRALSDTGPI